MSSVSFPEGFIWGTATSSYQIEGAVGEDGRGKSIWDRFAHAGNIKDGTSGDVACDHYHRWPEDIAIMKQIGLDAYRFSVAWPRILPEGRGSINHKGLDFYSRLVDGLLEAGITPFLTLYHWDLPVALQDEGGWVVRSTAEAFVEYTQVVSRHLGDRVKHWITHNEPWCASLLSYQVGLHAPGLRDYKLALAAAHHLLLSHGWAVSAVRHHSPGAEVGITLNLTPSVPASPSAADYDAYRHFDGWINRWFLDPLHGRGYPADMIADYTAAGHLPPEGVHVVQPHDLSVIATPTDFLGVNYYMRAVVRSRKVPEAENLPRTVTLAPESEWTDMGWEVYPDGLFQILMRVHLAYAPGKIYITENGASFGQGPDDHGRIPDTNRVRFLRDHFVSARRAMACGAPVAGYFVWSLLDNFEWDRGYAQRFGIVWVDYPSQKRILKESALWLQKVIADNAVETD